MDSVYLHVGCGPFQIPGFTNTDKEMNIAEPWPYGDQSVDGIASSHVLQELPWRELVKAFAEMKRVLKPDGVLRFGVPHVGNGYPLEFLLGFGNVNLFSSDLLRDVLFRIGFAVVSFPPFWATESRHPRIVEADNREDETLFVEAFPSKEGLA